VSRIFEVLSEPIKRLMELGKGTHGGAFAQRIHRELVRALEAQDLSFYEKVMRQHLNKGRRFLADERKKARIAASLRKTPVRKRTIRNA
jgi:DNA-binding FadR family transcriptional regulator